jgi:GT2 family glycosyltransferase
MSTVTGVIIVNFNAGEALTRCIESVLSQGEAVRLLVADNASHDGSAESVNRLFGKLQTVRVMVNAENLGFARAVNRASAAEFLADVDYLLVLNPDCELYSGALRALREALAARPKEAGVAGPRVTDRQGEPLRGTYRRFPDPWRSFLTFSGLWRLGRFLPGFEGVEPVRALPEQTVSAEAVSGACMMLERKLFEEVEGLDEAYGLHCEDLDLMYRITQRGRPCLYVPSAHVYHEQGVSSRSRPAWVHWQKHRGMQRFFTLHQAGKYRFPIRWLVTAGIWLRFALTLPMVLLRK